jgi:hypothetical protein
MQQAQPTRNQDRQQYIQQEAKRDRAETTSAAFKNADRHHRQGKQIVK